MFTWICPKCGTEVPPSYSECPNCAADGAQSTTASVEAPPQPGPRPQAPPQSVPAARALHLPAWLVTILVAGGLVGLGALVYYLARPKPEPAPVTSADRTGPPLATPSKAHPLARYLEVTGIRITEDAAQKAQVQFVVVNHSGADIGDLGGTISLRPVGAKPEHAPVASFSFKVPSIGPYESKELKETVHSNMRAYELPDWQFLQAQFEITSPPAPQ